MTEQSKPREFWIRFHIGDCHSTHQITDVSLNPLGNYKEDFHVIEYSAFERLKVENERLRKALKAECCCPDETSDITGLPILCDACEALAEGEKPTLNQQDESTEEAW